MSWRAILEKYLKTVELLNMLEKIFKPELNFLTDSLGWKLFIKYFTRFNQLTTTLLQEDNRCSLSTVVWAARCLFCDLSKIKFY